jgi:hypothetical protein
VLYERDELAAALEHAIKGVAGCRQLAGAWSVTPARPLAESLVVLARIRAGTGRPCRSQRGDQRGRGSRAQL